MLPIVDLNAGQMIGRQIPGHFFPFAVVNGRNLLDSGSILLRSV
jgi:hypothetical protein